MIELVLEPVQARITRHRLPCWTVLAAVVDRVRRVLTLADRRMSIFRTARR